ncbi:50S ribosomal protein L11 methyltransferase [Pueribacillus sp. YX66]|uniref:50S ribosomal protein L11 methyltransferase n=1 Tax=Pueribacillus sp. YX66 TaxID=3229242 RepID=UPI00358D828A
MDWAEICIHTTQEAVEIVSNLLHEAGSNGVVIEDQHDLENVWDTSFGEVYELNPDNYPLEGVYIKAYFPDDGTIEQTLIDIRAALQQLDDADIDFGEKTIRVSKINDENWSTAWKQYYKPIHVSNRIVIIPSWEQYTKRHADELIITLDPGMAFGTGTHETTILCIRAIEKYIERGYDVIDVGTGTGILSIVAVKLGANNVYAYDLDPVAIESAKANVDMNNVAPQVFVSKGNLLENVYKRVDLIIANILAPVVIQLVEHLPNTLNQNGRFIASGIIKNQQQAVEESLESAGLVIEEVMSKNDWVAIIARKEEDI